MYVVQLPDQHLDVILKEMNRMYPKETGGVLMGHWSDPEELSITNIIGPGPRAVHNLYSFMPDHTYHVTEIAKLFRATEGRETYLGDWHTHPLSGAYLSDTDKKTLKAIADYKPARVKKPLMLILGARPAEVKAWILEYKGMIRRRAIQECSICFSE